MPLRLVRASCATTASRPTVFRAVLVTAPVASALLLLTLAGPGVRLVVAEGLLAGVGVSDLTPNTDELEVPLGGYGERQNRPAEGVHDSVLAKTLVLAASDERFALITTDLLGPTRDLRNEVLERITATGISSHNLVLAASHSHASIEMNAMHRGNVFNNKSIGIFDERVLEFAADRIASSVVAAASALEPVRVASTTVQIPGMNRNRRGDETVDEDMTLLRLDRATGEPLAVLVNYTAHPTFMGSSEMLFSARWPGYLQRELEAHLGGSTVVLFTNGAEGDQSTRGAVGPSAWARAEDYGRKLSLFALAALTRMKTTNDVATMEWHTRTIELPARVPPPALMESAGPEYGLTPENIKTLTEAMQPTSTLMTVFRIGDLGAVTISGEMAAGLGLEIKHSLRELGIKHPMIVGLANEWISYILSTEGYHGGGYEPGLSFYGEGLGPFLVDEAEKTASHLLERGQ